MAVLHGCWLLQPLQVLSQSGTAAPGVQSSEPEFWGCLFLWGETWRRLTSESLGADPAANSDTASHPYAMAIAELLEFLRSLQQERRLRLPSGVLEVPVAVGSESTKARRTRAKARAVATETIANPRRVIQQVAVPSYRTQADSEFPGVLLPQLSAMAVPGVDAVLYPWKVEGICLTPLEALTFLNSLPLGSVASDDSFLGGDLRFWSHVARWSLDLLARSKFLPGLEWWPQESEQGEALPSKAALARWQPLLDSGIDQLRLTRFTEQMPAVCRMYQPSLGLESAPPLAIGLPTSPQRLLQSFLGSVLDAQVRSLLPQHPLPGESKSPRSSKPLVIEATIRQWLQRLGQPTATVVAPEVSSLIRSLTTWTAPLQQRGFEQSQFRACLYLHPPESGQVNWQLEYFLQAVDTPDLLIQAPLVWGHPVESLQYRGRVVMRPQETLLMGLGLASRLYPPLEPSLQEPRPQFCPLTPLQAYEFVKTVSWRLQDSGLGVVVPPSLANQGGWANRLGLRIQAQAGKLKQGDRLGLQSLLNFRWELTIGGQSLTKTEFDRLVALNTPLIEINGEWVELRPQDIRAAQNFFASRKDQTSLSLEDALRISTGDTQLIEKLPVVSFEASGSLQELINTLNGNRTITAIAAPAEFQGELRPYQARGVGWLAFLEEWGLGACLADDMGLGKTIQLIAFLLHLKQQKGLEKPTLLICPTSVLGNWEREVKKFAPSLQVALHHGDQRCKGKNFAKAVQDKDLVITSYALIHRDLKDLQSLSWQGVVLDEAQNVKNPDAKQSQAVRQLDAQFRIALTGTPVENRLSELWSILDFLNPGYLGPKNFFQRRFATPIERYGDTSSLQTLRSLVQPFILRRLKSDRDIIQDLPEKQEITVFCGLTTEQASLYQHLVEKSLADIEAADGIQRKGIILALLVKLKQICNHPALFLKDGEAEVAPATATPAFHTRSGKLQRLAEMLEEVVAEGDRALIFTQFAEWGKLLQAHLEKQLGRETLFLYGSTAKKQREEMVDRFQHDPQGPRIFILSLKAGGVGLNLTRANHVFHFDRWWNPAVENQATDRVFRIGQTRNVQVHKFVCNGTLEEKIHDLIESKKALADQIVGAGEGWITELDTNQLRDLLLLDRNAIIGEE